MVVTVAFLQERNQKAIERIRKAMEEQK